MYGIFVFCVNYWMHIYGFSSVLKLIISTKRESVDHTSVCMVCAYVQLHEGRKQEDRWVDGQLPDYTTQETVLVLPSPLTRKTAHFSLSGPVRFLDSKIFDVIVLVFPCRTFLLLYRFFVCRTLLFLVLQICSTRMSQKGCALDKVFKLTIQMFYLQKNVEL